MDAGCFGRLECVLPPDTKAKPAGSVPALIWLRDQIAATTAKDVAVERHWPADIQGDDFQFVEIGPDFDDQIGSLLESLDDECAVLVLAEQSGSDDAPHAAFILAVPICRLSGELEGVHVFDMAATLLELGGYGVPSSLHGRSLVADACDGLLEPALADADEEILRQRLSGLGYI
jgi:hypothetical protein